MKDYEVYIDITGVVVYRVLADSPQDAIERVMQGEYDDMDLSEWTEDLDSNNFEVVELD
jgi:hypothetical protein